MNHWSCLQCLLPSVLWCCWLGGRKGIRPVKNWVVGCRRGYLSAARCRLAYGPVDATATHCLFSKMQTGFTFLVLAHLGSPGQRDVKRVCVWLNDSMMDLMMTDPRSSSRHRSVLNSFMRLIMKWVKYELSRPPRTESLSRCCTAADSRSVSSIFSDSGNLCATRLDEISARTSRSTNTTYTQTVCTPRLQRKAGLHPLKGPKPPFWHLSKNLKTTIFGAITQQYTKPLNILTKISDNRK